MIEKMTLLSQHTPSTYASPSPLVGSLLKAASRNDSSAGSTGSGYLSKSGQPRLHAKGHFAGLHQVLTEDETSSKDRS